MSGLEMYAEFTSYYQKSRPPLAMSAPLWNDLAHHERMAWDKLADRLTTSLVDKVHEKELSELRMLLVTLGDKVYSVMSDTPADVIKRAIVAIDSYVGQQASMRCQLDDKSRTIYTQYKQIQDLESRMKDGVKLIEALKEEIASLRERMACQEAISSLTDKIDVQMKIDEQSIASKITEKIVPVVNETVRKHFAEKMMQDIVDDTFAKLKREGLIAEGIECPRVEIPNK